MAKPEDYPVAVWRKSPYRKGRVAHRYYKQYGPFGFRYVSRCHPTAPVAHTESFLFSTISSDTEVCPQCAALLLNKKPKRNKWNTGVPGLKIKDFSDA